MREIPRAHRLADGATLHVRALRPTDERALRAAFRELSPRSRHQRFLGPVTELSDVLWRYLCDVDGLDHVALVALDAGESRALGVARFIRLSTEPSTAEVAITVADPWQRRGLGSLLLDLLVDEAQRRGVVAFVAHTLPNNVAIRRLLSRQGTLRVSGRGDGAVTFVLSLRDTCAA